VCIGVLSSGVSGRVGAAAASGVLADMCLMLPLALPFA
jgi:hypothetical protein